MTDDILTPQEYATMHQHAFRAAFDFLNAHFPPGEGSDWWLQVANDASAASLLQGENKLVIELIIAVTNYIEYEWKRRQDDGKADD